MHVLELYIATFMQVLTNYYWNYLPPLLFIGVNIIIESNILYNKYFCNQCLQQSKSYLK